MWRLSFLIWASFPCLVCRPAERHVVLITIDGFPAALYSDPKTSIPHTRQLAAEGVSAERMHVSNPTVTWPNHTTLLSGVRPEKHSVLFNGVLTRGGASEPVSVDPKRDKRDLVAVPTIFDVLHKTGFRTAAIDWPCTRNSDSLDDDFPDSPEPLIHTSPRLLNELVSEGVLPNEKDGSFASMSGPGRDEVWVRAACHVIRKRKPHLLALHLLNTDGVHHRYGPGSSASYTALALADTYVGQVLAALESADIRANTTVIVTADHGFATATNILQPNVLLRQARLLTVGASNQVTDARVQVVPEGGSGMVYLNNPETREEDRRKVVELFSGKEGIAEVTEKFGAIGMPSPENHRGMADLLLAAKSGYGIAGSATGDDFVVHATIQSNVGYHGYLASNPAMDVPLVVSGPGIKHGTKIGTVENIDVAPTIARILGVKLSGAQGKVLEDLFEEER